AGFQDFVSKPVDARMLVSVVATLAVRSEAVRKSPAYGFRRSRGGAVREEVWGCHAVDDCGHALGAVGTRYGRLVCGRRLGPSTGGDRRPCRHVAVLRRAPVCLRAGVGGGA